MVQHLLLYHELADWWPMLSPPQAYRLQSRRLEQVILMNKKRKGRDMLVLGSGGGSLASVLRGRFQLTLVDAALPMLRVSRQLNPDSVHVLGDMRTLHLPERFTAVVAVDSISHLLTLEDVAAAARTAYEHCRPGGVAVFWPEFVEETFSGDCYSRNAQRDDVEMVCTRWTFRPDELAPRYLSWFVYLFRQGERTWHMDEHHRYGLFPAQTWVAVMEKAGFEPQIVRWSSTCGQRWEEVAVIGVKPLHAIEEGTHP